MFLMFSECLELFGKYSECLELFGKCLELFGMFSGYLKLFRKFSEVSITCMKNVLSCGRNVFWILFWSYFD